LVNVIGGARCGEATARTPATAGRPRPGNTQPVMLTFVRGRLFGPTEVYPNRKRTAAAAATSTLGPGVGPRDDPRCADYLSGPAKTPRRFLLPVLAGLSVVLTIPLMSMSDHRSSPTNPCSVSGGQQPTRRRADSASLPSSMNDAQPALNGVCSGGASQLSCFTSGLTEWTISSPAGSPLRCAAAPRAHEVERPFGEGSVSSAGKFFSSAWGALGNFLSPVLPNRRLNDGRSSWPNPANEIDDSVPVASRESAFLPPGRLPCSPCGLPLVLAVVKSLHVGGGPLPVAKKTRRTPPFVQYGVSPIPRIN